MVTVFINNIHICEEQQSLGDLAATVFWIC